MLNALELVVRNFHYKQAGNTYVLTSLWVYKYN